MLEKEERLPKYFLIAALVALGGAVRLWGLTFGLPFTGAHPDETVIVSTALRFGYGDLNPHSFLYPSLFFYLTAVAYSILYAGGHIFGYFPSVLAFKWQFFTDPSPFYLAARLLSAGLGTATVFFTYRLGMALAGRSAGLLAALLLAVNPLHVRNSHFATSDVAMTAFVTLGLLYAVRAANDGTLRDFIWSGIWFGLATSTKYPALLFLTSLLSAAVWPCEKDPLVPRQTRFYRLCLGLFCAAVALIFTSPFLLLDWPAAVRDIHYQSSFRSTGWFGASEPAWYYHLTFSLYYGIGILLLLVLVASITRLVMRRDRGALSIATGGVAYLVFMVLITTLF